ncbi:MAG: DUF6787 family protein [Flavitalea sp.]
MFKRLKEKWKVNNLDLVLILVVFALTGSSTVWLTAKITGWLNISSSTSTYWLLKIAMLVFGYPIILILLSIPFGQFRFFSGFLYKTWRRIRGLENEK